MSADEWDDTPIYRRTCEFRTCTVKALLLHACLLSIPSTMMRRPLVSTSAENLVMDGKKRWATIDRATGLAFYRYNGHCCHQSRRYLASSTPELGCASEDTNGTGFDMLVTAFGCIIRACKRRRRIPPLASRMRHLDCYRDPSYGPWPGILSCELVSHRIHLTTHLPV